MERLCSIIDSYKGMYIPLYDQWTARKSAEVDNILVIYIYIY